MAGFLSASAAELSPRATDADVSSYSRLDELVEISRTEENRFSSKAERDTVLELYQQARAFYSLRIESP